MIQKKEFKVLSPLSSKDGSTYWMKCGRAYSNTDQSINVYLDALPRGGEWKFQLRELDEEDLRRRESNRSARGSQPAVGQQPLATRANDVPF
jgi:hypothetical protein